MVQSGMCIGHVCRAYGRVIQPQHWTSNHHLHSTLNHPSPHLPPILHADANLSSRSPHPCKGIPPASKHPWLFILRESASQELEENQAQAKGQDEDERQRTCSMANLPMASPLEALSSQILSESGSSESVKRAVLPGTKLPALPSKLKTQGLESPSTRIPSPSVLTTVPHNAWQMTSACLRISVLTKLSNKLGGSMMDW
jgi:hypothetical protein